jgi:hypothetical protein
MRGFKEHDAADRFCRGHMNSVISFAADPLHNQYVSATRRRRRFLHQARFAIGIMQIA